MTCGARLAPGLTLRDGNGAGATSVGAVTAPAGVPTDTKQAYALAFSPLVDERVRYRVARWVIERAPAYDLAEVQEGLTRGTFVTVLALTTDEADVARQGIEGLGVAPSLVRLAPATTADMFLPERRTRSKPPERRSVGLGDWRTLVAAAVGLLVFGWVVVRLVGDRGF